MKKTGLNRYVYDFSVDYDIIDTSNIIDIHKYLRNKHDKKKKKCWVNLENICGIIN